MPNYSIFTQLKQRLLDMSALTRKLQTTAGAFSDALAEYLRELLEFSQAQRLYIASDVALTADKLLTWKTDRTAAAGMARHNARKERDAFAAECLASLHGTIKSFLEKDARTFDECGDIWRQVLSRALAKGYRFDNIAVSDRADTIIAALKSDEEFIPYYAHVSGLVGIYNAKALLDTTLPQMGL